MSEFLFYVGIVGFCLGICIGTLSDSSLPVVVWLVGLAFILGVIWRRGSEAPAAFPVLLLSVCLFATALGLLRVEASQLISKPDPLLALTGTEVTLTGMISREPDVRQKTQHLYITLSDGTTVLVYAERYGQYAYGDVVTAVGTLAVPETFTTELGRTFNYPGYLAAKGVSYTMSFANIVVTETGQGNPILSTLLTGKQHFMDTLELLLPEPQVGLAEGLVLGVQQSLGSKLEDDFRRTGIIHIVVLSGYNVALVVAFVMTILAFIIPFRLRIVAGVVAIVAFALTVGLSATVVRASIMAVFILLAKFLGRTYAVLRGLMIAGVIMLLLNPLLLVYDVGFQLSFLATLGLILGTPAVERFVWFMPKALGLREFFIATLTTQLFVTPFLLYQIGQISMVAVIVNVLVLPMVPVAMLLTFITGVVGLVSSTLALPMAGLAQVSLTYILTLASWFSDIPFAAYTVPTFSVWWVLVAYVALGYGWWALVRGEWAGQVDVVRNVDGWVIDEDVVRGEVQKSTEVSTAKLTNASTDAPIFFR